MLRILFGPCLLAAFCMGRTSSMEAENRIVGGRIVDISEFPYQLSFEMSGKHNCGASVISRKFALTAAHCYDKTIKDYKLRTGTSVKHLGGRVHNVSTIWIHPKYIYSTRELDYDVALLEIEDTFEYSDTTKPIAIAKSTDIKPGDVLIVSGWGKTKYENTEGSTELHATDVPFVPHYLCKFVYNGERHFLVTPRMICAGTDKKSFAPGDSGGPMTTKDKQIQIGIVSWIWPGFPGVYVDVRNGEIRSWIRTISDV